ncbi:hypothetical protein [Halorientalis pallida]|uniref:Uncharacterized protein n=1 Tax=Halorientalis pallida TaxID=2479928 RepID=A0A498KZR9_9EURY|nr:hypothetical protein [Halorientalis pallida]RXK51530.1 hypothetical protein EAF64_02545 [Halorientalis pallida]
MAAKWMKIGKFFIGIVRSIFFTLVTIISGFAVGVSAIGRLKIFSSLPSILLFLVIPQEEALEIRNDITTALQDGTSAAIKEFGTQGYPNRQSMRHIQNRAEESIPSNRQLFETGEFGLSLLLTSFAILTAYLGVGGIVSVVLAILTGLLILSVAIRISLINHLAYQEIPSASFSKLISVWYWNEKVMGAGFPLLNLLAFRLAKSTYEPFYHLVLETTAKSAVKSVQNPEVGMTRLFWQEIRSPFKEMIIELYQDAQGRESPVDA